MLLYKIEITHDGAVTERHLGAGIVLIGGGLQADLVVPALLDAELCEVVLPADAAQPIRVTALVEGLIVNEKVLRLKQADLALVPEIAIDNVVIRITSLDEAAQIVSVKKSDKMLEWLEKSKPVMPSGGVMALIQQKPAYAMFGAAGVFALIAFIISGWPTASFKPAVNGAGTSQSAADRNGIAGLIVEIRRRLVAADLGAFVRAEQSSGAIRLTGSANPQQAQRLDDILKLVTKPGGTAIRNEVVMTSADAATGVESIVTAPVRGIVVAGGQLFNEGQTIPSGWLIEKISHNEVKLKRDSIEHVIVMKDTVQEISPAPRPTTSSIQKANPVSASRSLQSISTPPRETYIGPTLPMNPQQPR